MIKIDYKAGRLEAEGTGGDLIKELALVSTHLFDRFKVSQGYEMAKEAFMLFVAQIAKNVFEIDCSDFLEKQIKGEKDAEKL